ncbi:hypothetical protein C8R44DRAFT_768839 [Mycena epipterygia]|nr:hypothetical protein C8R44DRAFT_768839 [Mycena epipterygia]
MSDHETVVLAKEIFLQNSCHLIGTTILYWDHLITLDREINLIWRRRKSLSAYCFIANRYFAFLSGIPVSALPFLSLAPKICLHYSLFREIELIATQALVSIVMIIRVYALFGRNSRVLGLLIGIAAVAVAVSVWSLSGQHASRPATLGGCHFELTQATSFHLAGGWEALFAFDSIIFGLSVYNAFAIRRRMLPQTNLHTLVVRDGAMYFGIMALANLANIATYYFSAPVLPGSLATFANCISVTMISRLILNLHEHANVGVLTERTNQVVDNNIPLGSLDDLSAVDESRSHA